MTNTKPLAEIWGEAIRRTRLDQELSLADLAARTGIDAGHLSRGERGLAGFGDDYRMRIARALGRPVADLFPYPATNQEIPCPPAANAPDGDASPTQETTADHRSPARCAKAPAASEPEGSPANE